jgi:hypothetical protein
MQLQISHQEQEIASSHSAIRALSGQVEGLKHFTAHHGANNFETLQQQQVLQHQAMARAFNQQLAQLQNALASSQHEVTRLHEEVARLSASAPPPPHQEAEPQSGGRSAPLPLEVGSRVKVFSLLRRQWMHGRIVALASSCGANCQMDEPVFELLFDDGSRAFEVASAVHLVEPPRHDDRVTPAHAPNHSEGRDAPDSSGDSWEEALGEVAKEVGSSVDKLSGWLREKVEKYHRRYTRPKHISTAQLKLKQLFFDHKGRVKLSAHPAVDLVFESPNGAVNRLLVKTCRAANANRLVCELDSELEVALRRYHEQKLKLRVRVDGQEVFSGKIPVPSGKTLAKNARMEAGKPAKDGSYTLCASPKWMKKDGLTLEAQWCSKIAGRA